MMKLLAYGTLLTIAFPVFSTPEASPSAAVSLAQRRSPDLSGAWHTESGMELHLKAKKHKLTGTYWSSASAFQIAAGSDLTGYCDDQSLAASALLSVEGEDGKPARSRFVTISATLVATTDDERLVGHLISIDRDLLDGEPASTPTVSEVEFRRGPATAKLSVSIAGVRKEQGGQVIGTLHEKEKTFPMGTDEAPYSKTVRVTDDVATIVFEGVRPGEYVFVGIHDKNSDGKVNRGLLGPSEGITVSGQDNSRPPRFKRSKFTVGRGSNSLDLSFRYP